MSKRKSSKSRKTDAVPSDVAKPAAAPEVVLSSAAEGSDGAELQALPETETRLPDVPGAEIEPELPPVPPVELEAIPTLPPHLAQQIADVTQPAEPEPTAQSERREGDQATTAGPSEMDGRRRATAGMEACQTLIMEMTRDNLDFAARLASMRSPLDMLGAATDFAGKRMAMYGRFSKAFADIAAGRRPPKT
jgi:hypothetical protein